MDKTERILDYGHEDEPNENGVALSQTNHGPRTQTRDTFK